jgi:hypothetical protein
MDKTKAKNKPSAPSIHQDRRDFWGLWILSQTILLLFLWLFLNPREDVSIAFANFGLFAYSVVCTAIVTLSVTTLQQRTAARFLKHSFEGWAVVSALGSMFSVGALLIFRRMGVFASALALLLPMAWIQMLWLWQHVRSAWLWPLVNLLGSLLLVLPFREYNTETQMRVWAGLIIIPLQAVIQTVVMRHLWTQLPEKDKIMQEPDAEMLNDQASLQRLSLTESAETAIDEQTWEGFYDQDKSQK